MKMGHTWLKTACVVAMVAAVFPAQAEGKLEKKDINIAMATGAVTYLPVILADGLGYFKEQGLNVKESVFAGGSKALEALMGGSADMVAGAYSHTINIQTKANELPKGKQLVNFVVQVDCPGLAVAVSKEKAKTIRSLEDLKGKSIGVTAPGSSTHMLLNYILGRKGIQPREFSVLGIGASAGAVAAVKTGQVDAFVEGDPAITILKREVGVSILANMLNPESTKEVLGNEYPEASLYTTREFLEKNPNTAQAITNAVVKAEKWIAKASAKQVVDAMPAKFVGSDKELYAAAFEDSRECLSKTGLMPEGGPEVVKDILASFLPNVANAKIDLAATYTNKFAEEANK